MAQWIDDLYEPYGYRNRNIGENTIKILEFSGYKVFKKRPKEENPEEIIPVIGFRSGEENVDVFLLIRLGEFNNIPEDTLFIQTNDFKKLISSKRYKNGVYYEGNLDTLWNYDIYKLLIDYDPFSAELLKFIEDAEEYININWRNENGKD